MLTDEKSKDKVLQHVSDVLEEHGWGEETDLLVVEIIFEKQKFNCRIETKRKERKRIYS